MTTADRLDRLERHLDEMLAGPRRLMRSLSKTTTGSNAMTAARETVYPVTSWSEYNEPGLTKREMFAMMSLQGLIANPDFLTEAADESLDPFAAAAQLAVRQADALIAELNKETP